MFSTPSEPIEFFDNLLGLVAGGTLIYKDAQTTVGIQFQAGAIGIYDECFVLGVATQA